MLYYNRFLLAVECNVHESVQLIGMASLAHLLVSRIDVPLELCVEARVDQGLMVFLLSGATHSESYDLALHVDLMRLVDG